MYVWQSKISTVSLKGNYDGQTDGQKDKQTDGQKKIQYYLIMGQK